MTNNLNIRLGIEFVVTLYGLDIGLSNREATLRQVRGRGGQCLVSGSGEFILRMTNGGWCALREREYSLPTESF
jgi:hypothetical protein